MTPAVETGYRPAEPGGHPIWHYRMAPGTALLVDDDARTMEPVEVTTGMARRAKDTHILRWVNGKTVVVFELDGKSYAQLMPRGEIPSAPASRAKADRPRLAKAAAPAPEPPPPVTPVKRGRKRAGLL